MSAHVKGVVLKARVDYLTKFHGEEAFERLLESLKPETRALLEGGVLSSSWYPVQASVEMLETMDRLYGKGDLALCREMGRFSARAALGGVYRGYVRQKDFAFVNRMTPKIYRQYYDSGRMVTEVLGKGRAATRVLEFEAPHRVICLGLLGWIEAANGVWGADGVSVEETKCRLLGHDCCEYIITRPVEK